LSITAPSALIPIHRLTPQWRSAVLRLTKEWRHPDEAKKDADETVVSSAPEQPGLVEA